MEKSTPLDCADSLFKDVSELGRSFEKERKRPVIEPDNWLGFLPLVQKILKESASIAPWVKRTPQKEVATKLQAVRVVIKKILDSMELPQSKRWAAYSSFFPELNTLGIDGHFAVMAAKGNPEKGVRVSTLWKEGHAPKQGATIPRPAKFEPALQAQSSIPRSAKAEPLAVTPPAKVGKNREAVRNRLLNAATDGAYDEKFTQIEDVIISKSLSVDEKLNRIYKIFPPILENKSSREIAKLLEVSQSIVLKSGYWSNIRNRKEAEEAEERKNNHRERNKKGEGTDSLYGNLKK